MGAVFAIMGSAFAACLALPGMIFSAMCCCIAGISCVCTVASTLACCCRGAMGAKTGVHPRLAKLFYIIILVLCSILALVFRFNSYAWSLGTLSLTCSNSVLQTEEVYNSLNQTVYCKGEAAVYRISFILVLFYGLIMCLSLLSEGAHRGFWGAKIILLCGGLAGSFFIPETGNFSQNFAWFARILSFFFLIMQILVLIDFAYQWNEGWVKRAYAGMDSEDPSAKPTRPIWLILVLSSALVLYFVAVLGGEIVLYLFYSQCPIGMGMATWTLLAVVIMTGLSLFREQLVGVPGAILPAGVVSAYVVFLGWSALESNTDPTCRPTGSVHETQSAMVWGIVLGFLWMLVTLVWATYSVSENAQHLVKAEPLIDAEAAQHDQQTQAQRGGKGAPVPLGGPVVREALADRAAPRSPNNATQHQQDAGDTDDDDYPVYSTERLWPFHLILLCASCYMAMVLTDWGSTTITSTTSTPASNATDVVFRLNGNASMAVKVAAQVVTVILFTWTLVAPGILRNRQFS